MFNISKHVHVTHSENYDLDPRYEFWCGDVIEIFVLRYSSIVLRLSYDVRPPDESGYWKTIFLISQPKYMF